MASTIRLCAASHRITVVRRSSVIRSSPTSRRCRSLAESTSLRWQSSAAAARAEPTTTGESLGAEGPEELSFESLRGRINHGTLKAITVKPFKLKTMTPVQAAVLPMLPELAEPYNPETPDAQRPPDLLVKAKTGTGKTLAFLVPAIEARLKSIEAVTKKGVKDAGLVSDKQLAARIKRIFTRTEVGTLIISPTRELATQIANEALRLAHHHDDLEVRLFVGGVSKRLQLRDWMKGRRDIVVATPGRLMDLLNSEPDIKHGIGKTKMLILDEGDTLLDMGFRDDIDQIVEFLPPNPQRQNYLFSATVSREIRQVARSVLNKDHVFINTVSDTDTPVHISVPQYHTVLPSAADQIPHILRLIIHDQLSNPGKSKIILFLPTTKMTQLFSTLIRQLATKVLPSQENTRVYEIHSKRTQDARSATSDAFRHDKSGASILVSSDVSARGVDYPNVTRVIQIGIPSGAEQYIHRIGRTGRAGTTGRGDLVLLPWEVGFVTWQLDDIPLKPLTTNELKSQVSALAEAYDANPMAAFKGLAHAIQPDVPIMRGETRRPRIYQAPVLPNAQSIPQAVEELLPALDEEAVKETFASLLGYYISKSPELRTQKGVIVQGCKDWTTGACGLPVPPYVSDAFLQRLGFSDGRTKRFGMAYSPSPRARSSGPAWSGRGHQRLKGRTRDAPGWAEGPPPVDPKDPALDPDEYRSKRYDSRVRASPPHQQQRQRQQRPRYAGSEDDGEEAYASGRDTARRGGRDKYGSDSGSGKRSIGYDRPGRNAGAGRLDRGGFGLSSR